MDTLKNTPVLPETVRAVCFDLDGTLFDSENFYFEIYHDWLRDKYGKEITKDDFAYYETVLDDMLVAHLLESGQIIDDEGKDAVAVRADIQNESLRRFDELIKSESAQKGAALIHSFHDRVGIPLVLATCSEPPHVDPFLDEYDLREVFSEVLTGDMVTHKKPDPEVYLMALEHLGLGPDEVIVVEDSARGIAAARAADMTVLRQTAYLVSPEPAPEAIEMPDLASALELIEEHVA
ncbi:MAG: HAD family phosphatase [Actinomycetia bacterium]|nr:HAD family phosphatase [Actinomycetes bacterium]